MLHQAQEKRQVRLGNTFFIEGEDIIAGRGVEQIVGVLDAFGDALAGQYGAKIIFRDKPLQILIANFSIDRHRISVRRLVCVAS
jgi:hypothetical protein